MSEPILVIIPREVFREGHQWKMRSVKTGKVFDTTPEFITRECTMLDGHPVILPEGRPADEYTHPDHDEETLASGRVCRGGNCE